MEVKGANKRRLIEQWNMMKRPIKWRFKGKKQQIDRETGYADEIDRIDGVGCMDAWAYIDI
jgi:hypothetical protein